jgi:hypothetical protein
MRHTLHNSRCHLILDAAAAVRPSLAPARPLTLPHGHATITTRRTRMVDMHARKTRTKKKPAEAG